MSVQPLPDVHVIDLWPASVRYVLPRRRLGRGRIFCLILLIAGCLEAALLIHLLGTAFGGPHFILGRGGGAIVILIGIPTLAGLIPFWWGLAGLIGHREIEVRPERLMTVERVGPFWRSKRWRLGKIYAFDVVPITSGEYPGPDDAPLPAILEPFNALLVRLSGGGQGMLAWGYPAEMLRPLAVSLAERANAGLVRNGLPGEIRSLAKAAPVAGEDDLDLDEDESETAGFSDPGEGRQEAFEATPVVQPENSRIAVERFGDGVTIRVPPAGVWKGSSGLFFFSLLWNGFMTIFTSIAGLAVWQEGAADFEGHAWLFAGFIALFWAVGIGMLLGAVNMGRRQAALAVAGGRLLVIQTGLFGKKQREFSAAEVKEVCVGPSGMEMNDVPVLELQIRDREGGKLGILAGRDDDELHWLAYEMEAALGQSRSAGPAIPPMALESAEKAGG